MIWSLDEYRWGDERVAGAPAGGAEPAQRHQHLRGAPQRLMEAGGAPGGDADHPGAPRPADHATAAGADACAEGRASLNYGGLADELVPYAKEMGFTHLELMLQ